MLDYTNLFYPNEYEKDDKIILNYFQLLKGKDKKIYCVPCGKYRRLKNPKKAYILEKNISSFYYLQL